jgi:hypothetical protein
MATGPLVDTMDLPVELQSELELSGIVSCCRLPGQARGARRGIAQLVHCGNVGVIGKVESIRDQVELLWNLATLVAAPMDAGADTGGDDDQPTGVVADAAPVGAPLSCPILPIVRSCLCGCRTVKCVKTAWLGNAVAMMHYLRIVNSGGTQKWHGHDHEDEGHQTLPDWRGNASAASASVASFQNSALDGFPPLPT